MRKFKTWLKSHYTLNILLNFKCMSDSEDYDSVLSKKVNMLEQGK